MVYIRILFDIPLIFMYFSPLLIFGLVTYFEISADVMHAGARNMLIHWTFSLALCLYREDMLSSLMAPEK